MCKSFPHIVFTYFGIIPWWFEQYLASKRSQHMKGQALDLDDTFGHKTNAEMYHYIKDNLNYDQLFLDLSLAVRHYTLASFYSCLLF